MSDSESRRPRGQSKSGSSSRDGSKPSSSRKPKTAKRAGSAPARSRRGMTHPLDEEPPPDQPLDPDARSNEPFRNYSYPPEKGFLRVFLLFLQLFAVVLLFVLCVAPPNTSGGSLSVLKDTAGKEFVGVLRKCTDTTCDPWLGGSSSASGSPSTSGTANTGGTPEPTPAVKRSDPFPSPARPFFSLLPIRAVHFFDLHSRAGGLHPRAEGDIDLPTMYLTTGLATLTALWILLYMSILTFIRFACLSTPPEVDTSGWREVWKRFIHRATRIWLVVLSVLLGAVLLDVALKGVQYRSAKGLTGIDGIGPGLAIILFAWICCVICTLVEFGGDRTHGFFNSLSCGLDCECCRLFGREHYGKRSDVEEGGIPLRETKRSRTD